VSLIAVGKAKAWGTTTAVMALANVWPPERRLLVAECDPAGGDIAPRYGLGLEPGLVTLAAAARRELSAATVWANSQLLPGGVAVLVAPAAAEQARAALVPVAGRLPAAMEGEADCDVLADCGRLDPGSAALEVARSAALTVLVARATLEEMTHVVARVAALRSAGCQVVVVLVEDDPRLLGGGRPYRGHEVSQVVGAEVVGTLAHDARGAALLAGAVVGGERTLRRSPLIRSARELAATLAARAATPTRGPNAEPRAAGSNGNRPLGAGTASTSGAGQ
jgi:hypothetical protein